MPIPSDTLLNSQWHLGNSGGLLDLNVRAVWNPVSGAAYTGAGTRVVIIDDGFDYNHSDLAAPYDDFLDFDFDQVDLDPFGASTDSHGTAVTGIIGADNNGTGAVGVAFDSSLVGYRVHGQITDYWLQNVRDAIHHAAMSAQGDVANISLGIANDASSEFGTGYNAVRFDEIETSIGTAVASGRGGLGMTIVKAAGNSRSDNFDVNADDWTNDTRQVVVAAVDQNGFVSSYSSYGTALLISAFGTPGQVVTTDRTGAAGYSSNDFTSTFNGTSSAAPMVSGVVSLIYDANPDLGWRDVQSILANSARHVGSAVGAAASGSERYQWQWNGADTWNGGGLHFSNDYGYGLVDARAATRLAETWLLSSSAQRNSNQFSIGMDMLNSTVTIPDGNLTGSTFTGTASFNDEVERVTVQLTFSTTFTADMEIYLTSPQGTVSELIDDVGGGTDFNGTWTFESQAFRGERSAGTWSVRIVDDAGGDVLQVSDIVVRTFGRDGTDDRYVYTNEYNTYAGVSGHNTTLIDTNGGTDTINASAVTTGSTINLTQGATSTIAGRSVVIASGTVIENAYGGDGGDTLTGNGSDNQLFGGRGNDTINGQGGTDTVLFNGLYSSYTLTALGSSQIRFAGLDGTDTLSNVETFTFLGDQSASLVGTSLFQAGFLASNRFGSSASGGGWSSQNTYPRHLADVNGDNMDDIVGFGDAGMFVAFANGGGNFGATFLASSRFGASPAGGGWSSDERYPRLLADVNGGGLEDVIGFGDAGVYIALATGGGAFGATFLASNRFGTSAEGGGWSSDDRYPREVADVNGDGRADIIGFGDAGVYVTLATGGGNFGATFLVSNRFGASAAGGGWSSDNRYPREVADVDGNGMSDIIGFGDAGVYVALATGGGNFGATFLASPRFGASGAAGGWAENNVFPRMLADVNEDNRADIIGFGDAGFYVALATGGGNFAAPILASTRFGAGSNAGGWSSYNLFPRELGDVDGSGRADVVGFGDSGVFVSRVFELL